MDPQHKVQAGNPAWLSWIIFGLAVPAGAEVVNFKELLPFVDINIPGWTMEGQPCGTTLKQGKVMLSEARVLSGPVTRPWRSSLWISWGRPSPS